jgi:hypothetical protein
MDFDELKNRWQAESDKNIHINEQSMEQLHVMLKEKTAQTLNGIKEKYKGIISYLMIGLLANIAISPFLHYLLGDGKPVFRITTGGLLSMVVILSVGLITVFFYWIRYATLSTELISADIKSTLKENIVKLQKAFIQETIFILFIFVTLFVAGRLTSEYLGNGDFGDIFRKDILIALSLAIVIMCFYIFKRKQMYNRNINQLKGFLNELED